VALSRRSSSASVRYSRVRRSALGRRLGVTVRFTVAGVTSRRRDLAKVFAPLRSNTVRIIAQLQTVCNPDFQWILPTPTYLSENLGPPVFKKRALKGAAAAEVMGAVCKRTWGGAVALIQINAGCAQWSNCQSPKMPVAR